MTNKNVIEIINRLMDPQTEKIVYTASEAFTAIVHGYYYIRPGKNKIKFIKKINKILNDAWKDKSKTCVETKDGLLHEVRLYGKMAADAISVARSLFDEEYYASQIAKMVMHEKYDDTLLERYMYWLDEKELHSVFEGMLTFKRDYEAFITDENFEKMMEELEACCISTVKESPWDKMNYDEHIDHINNHWDFCFSYLRRETIIDTVCRYVDDPVMLAFMIKTFKYADVRSASEYTVLALLLAYEFELDIFDPTITDMDKIHLEDDDGKHLHVIHSNKAGKLMIATEAE